MGSDDVAGGPAEWVVPGYRHERELGSGASGRVVFARHLETGTAVAIKYLVRGLSDESDFRSAYRTEARLLGELTSPHVAQLYEYVETTQGAAIVMELVEGVSLRALLRAEGATIPEAALSVLKGSLLGLAAAHAAGVVHRDYKPENVLITPQGRSKLVDFGIAARSGETPVAAGTPLYMAPEQFTGAAAGPATDVYAATATFFECVTGAQPYSGTTIFELMYQHVEAPIPDERAPEPVRPLIRTGLAKAPGDRPPTAAEFVGALEHVAAGAYGEDWEERGQRKLATLLAALPLLLIGNQAAGPSGGTSVATTNLGSGGPGPGRFGLRRLGQVSTPLKVFAAVCAVLLVIVIAAVASASLGSGSNSSTPTSDNTAGAVTSVSGTAPAPAAKISVTPQPTNTSASPSASASASATHKSSSSPTPTTSPSPSPSPTLQISTVGITDYGCYNISYTQGTVTVTGNGISAGTLTLVWLYVTAAGGPDTVVSTQSVTVPAGQDTFTGTYTSPEFGRSAGFNAYWELRVSTTPTAGQTSGSPASVYGENCEIQ
jgi:eukaryotic-like serine/threonine-protein kinase